jgi:hypothetical protein
MCAIASQKTFRASLVAFAALASVIGALQALKTEVFQGRNSAFEPGL